MFKIDENFQTIPVVAKHMAEMAARCPKTTPSAYLNPFQKTVLEPTPGMGNLSKALNDLNPRCFQVYSPPGDFWLSQWHTGTMKFDVVAMNPPFSPVLEMERFVNRAMELSDNVIALLPWSYVINSERRMAHLMAYGLVSVTHLPRKTFSGCRVQVAIFELKKGYAGATQLKRFTW